MVAEREVNGNGNGVGEGRTTLIFTYGTLKRGFSNHPLLQDLIRSGDASFVGTYRTAAKYPLVCGPYKVPFLLNIPGSGHGVHGELYSVSTRGLERMDELEGTSRAHYERLPIKVVPAAEEEDDDGFDGEEEAAAGLTCAEAYYAHGNYAMELWKKNGKRGLRCYSQKETIGYVKRKDRPQHLTFLDHIRFFLSSN
ncbi:putative gamma-glutamylcyclotransferase [Glycine soja]|uniref:Gamma-glutamylcyclotransferase family protein n=1 Tax=Glycine soja TaxID=3848 RepID=A0A0B2SPI3_GLYSO|nr:putative gamma-glutamylcyclotransferase At3g02910 [Glycine soja]KHN46474.1 Putative gamma-glutamylcyclotransferase [Glycine soja]RZB73762.1 putative gamma-glutamylcyclotransferase [Glycine soja]